MAKHSSDNRNQEFMDSFRCALVELSRNLFCARADILMDFYGKVFDDRPECAELIIVPGNYPNVTPTTYAVYREARFVLDSELSDSDDLDAFWARLHQLIGEALDPAVLAKIAELNSKAREWIMGCKNDTWHAAVKLADMLNADDVDEAELFALCTICDIENTFNKIVISYNLALQPR